MLPTLNDIPANITVEPHFKNLQKSEKIMCVCLTKGVPLDSISYLLNKGLDQHLSFCEPVTNKVSAPIV